MWWVLGIAVWAGLIAYLVIAYRRKVGDRNRTRDAQFEQLMAEARAAKTTAAAAPAAGAVAPAAPGTPSGPASAATAAPWVRKERLLDQPRALVYLLLRAGLPEHEVFANLTLADVVGTGAAGTGFEREQRVRRLGQIRTDFVVCTRRLEPVAVLALKSAGAAGAAAAENARLMAECLTAAGVRYVSIDPAAPPRHAELRALVLGG
jgi:hypothetical protein